MATEQTGQSKQESEAPVAARAELDQAQGTAAGDSLEQRAKDQERQQREALQAGKGGEAKEGPTVAHNRAPVGSGDRGVQHGLVDGMTRRDLSDALTGHFVTIDRTHNDLTDAAREALPEGGDGYGVFLEAAKVDEHGYPVTAIVRLRDASSARVVVPYDSLAPAEAGAR